jgi:hypothetical protein
MVFIYGTQVCHSARAIGTGVMHAMLHRYDLVCDGMIRTRQKKNNDEERRLFEILSDVKPDPSQIHANISTEPSTALSC